VAPRLAIASLPFLAAAAVVAVVLSSQSASPPATAVTTETRVAPAAPVSAHRPRHRALPRPPDQIHGGAARRTPVPILMYHVIADRPPAAPYAGLWVRPDVFAAEMTALRHAGYWAITLRQAWRAWTRGGPLPRKPVVVSFDDGYLGQYTHARPVLRRLGWPGVLNLALQNVGPRLLKAREVRALIAEGWEVDSHTLTHPDLTRVGDSQLATELTGSRRALARRFAVKAQFFCYPYGRYDARVEAAVRRAGYLAASTENEGYATAATPFALPRVRVQANDTPASLLARLAAERPRREV
jgi:peptidoglycan/xylan/chitin deacetylase (PgdA/CDA1 family)